MMVETDVVILRRSRTHRSHLMYCSSNGGEQRMLSRFAQISELERWRASAIKIHLTTLGYGEIRFTPLTAASGCNVAH